VAVEKALGMKQLLVFIENYSGKENEIIKKLNTRFPNYKIHEKIIGIEQFPLNSSGKTDKKALISQYNLLPK